MPARMPDNEVWGQWSARLNAECGPLAAAAWAAIRRRMGPRDEPAAIGVADLAAGLARSERTVREVLRRLAATGWLVVQRTGRQGLLAAVVSTAEHIETGEKLPLRPAETCRSDRQKPAGRAAPPYTPPCMWRRNRERGGERGDCPAPPCRARRRNDHGGGAGGRHRGLGGGVSAAPGDAGAAGGNHGGPGRGPGAQTIPTRRPAAGHRVPAGDRREGLATTRTGAGPRGGRPWGTHEGPAEDHPRRGAHLSLAPIGAVEKSHGGAGGRCRRATGPRGMAGRLPRRSAGHRASRRPRLLGLRPGGADALSLGRRTSASGKWPHAPESPRRPPSRAARSPGRRGAAVGSGRPRHLRHLVSGGGVAG